MIGLAALQVCPSGLPAHYPAPPAQPESAEQIAASSSKMLTSSSSFSLGIAQASLALRSLVRRFWRFMPLSMT